MEASYPFRQSEMDTDAYYTGYHGTQFRKYHTPVTPRENIRRLYRGERPLWIPRMRFEKNSIDLRINPDNIARGPEGGKDMFGVSWLYDPVSRGSMVRPGNPFFTDANEWRKHIRIPDVAHWDWEGFAGTVVPSAGDERFRIITVMNGLFERLISWMDFENAAVALIDEEQKDAVHDIMDALCGMYEDIIRHAVDYLDIDSVTFHDDWGSQRAPLFSVATCREMLQPYIGRLAAFAHSVGIRFEFHSCGNVGSFVPLMIEAGADAWEGQNSANDMLRLLNQYGDRILITVTPPDVRDIPENELEDVADAFLSQVGCGKRAFFGMNEKNRRLDMYLYRKTRIMLSE